MVPSGTRVLTLLLPSTFRGECRGDYITPRTRVRLPPPASVVVVQQQDIGHVAAPLVVALAVEAQAARHLTGNEEMEGAIPSDGSLTCGNGSRVEREVASLEIRVRFPVAAPAE